MFFLMNIKESQNRTVPLELNEETRRKEVDDSSSDIRSRMRSSHSSLYINQFFEASGKNAWLFTVGIFLVACAPYSLRLTAIHGFACAGANLLLGSVVTRWTKRTNILTVAYVLVTTRQVAMAASAVAVSVALNGHADVDDGKMPAAMVVQCVIVVTSAIAAVASLGRQASLKRDWVPNTVEDGQTCTEVTAMMHWINVACRLTAPLLIGYMMTSLSIRFVAIAVALWSIVTVFIELFMLRVIYTSMPDEVRREDRAHRDDLNETSALLASSNLHFAGGTDRNFTGRRTLVECEGNLAARDGNSATRDGYYSALFDGLSTLWDGLGTYWNHSAVGAGLGLALLHFCVIRFDNIVVGFAKGSGMAEVILGVFVSASVCLATAGDMILPSLRDKIDLRKAGLVAFLVILIPLTLPVASLFVPGNTYNPFYDAATSHRNISGNMNLTTWWLPGWSGLPSLPLLLLMIGIALASFGIQLAKAMTNSLLENESSASNSVVVQNVQRVLNLAAQQAKWVLVWMLPWPGTFGWIVLIAFSSVLIATGLFGLCRGSRRRGYNSLVFAAATQPQKRFAGSYVTPMNL